MSKKDDVQAMKDRIAELQNQLASMEMETTKEVTKVEQTVKAEKKQVLKEETMDPLELIEYLKRSNELLQEEGEAMLSVMQDLQEHNEMIATQTAFRLEHLVKERVEEIEIAELVKEQLEMELPTYRAMCNQTIEKIIELEVTNQTMNNDVTSTTTTIPEAEDEEEDATQ